MTEEMYQNLVVRAGQSGEPESVHLASYPEPDEKLIDERLAHEMRAVRDIVSLGLSVRAAGKLRVRQPLSHADVVFNDRVLLDRLESYKELIADELNVHEVHFMFPGHEQGAVTFRIKPNFRALGPRLGKGVQAVKKVLDSADGSALYEELGRTGKLQVEVGGESLELSRDELDVVVEGAPGFAAETGRIGVVVLHTALTEELVDEGIFRELLSRIQATRKELGLEFTDRIELFVDGTERLSRVARAGEGELRGECLATRVYFGERAEGSREHAIGDEALWLAVRKSE
jgi:isoleucyl-tRNA synthetase